MAHRPTTGTSAYLQHPQPRPPSHIRANSPARPPSTIARPSSRQTTTTQQQHPSAFSNLCRPSSALTAAALVYGSIPKGGGTNPDQLSERSMASALAHQVVEKPPSKLQLKSTQKFHAWTNDEVIQKLPPFNHSTPPINPNQPFYFPPSQLRQQSQHHQLAPFALSAGVPTSFGAIASIGAAPTFPYPPPPPPVANHTATVNARSKKSSRPPSAFGITIPKDTTTHFAPPSTSATAQERLNQTADARRVALANWLHQFDGQREKMHRSIDIRPYLYKAQLAEARSTHIQDIQAMHLATTQSHRPSTAANLQPHANGPMSPRPGTAQQLRPRPPNNSKPTTVASSSTSSHGPDGRPGTSLSYHKPPPTSYSPRRPATAAPWSSHSGPCHPTQQIPHGFFVVPSPLQTDQTKYVDEEKTNSSYQYAPNRDAPSPTIYHDRSLTEEFIRQSAAANFNRQRYPQSITNNQRPSSTTSTPFSNPQQTVSPIDRNLLLSYFISQSNLFRDTINVRIENRELDELIIRGHDPYLQVSGSDGGGSGSPNAFGVIGLLELLDSVSYRYSTVQELLDDIILFRSIANQHYLQHQRQPSPINPMESDIKQDPSLSPASPTSPPISTITSTTGEQTYMWSPKNVGVNNLTVSVNSPKAGTNTNNSPIRTTFWAGEEPNQITPPTPKPPAKISAPPILVFSPKSPTHVSAPKQVKKTTMEMKYEETEPTKEEPVSQDLKSNMDSPKSITKQAPMRTELPFIVTDTLIDSDNNQFDDVNDESEVLMTEAEAAELKRQSMAKLKADAAAATAAAIEAENKRLVQQAEEDAKVRTIEKEQRKLHDQLMAEQQAALKKQQDQAVEAERQRLVAQTEAQAKAVAAAEAERQRRETAAIRMKLEEDAARAKSVEADSTAPTGSTQVNSLSPPAQHLPPPILPPSPNQLSSMLAKKRLEDEAEANRKKAEAELAAQKKAEADAAEAARLKAEAEEAARIAAELAKKKQAEEAQRAADELAAKKKAVAEAEERERLAAESAAKKKADEEAALALKKKQEEEEQLKQQQERAAAELAAQKRAADEAAAAAAAIELAKKKQEEEEKERKQQQEREQLEAAAALAKRQAEEEAARAAALLAKQKSEEEAAAKKKQQEENEKAEQQKRVSADAASAAELAAKKQQEDEAAAAAAKKKKEEDEAAGAKQRVDAEAAAAAAAKKKADEEAALVAAKKQQEEEEAQKRRAAEEAAAAAAAAAKKKQGEEAAAAAAAALEAAKKKQQEEEAIAAAAALAAKKKAEEDAAAAAAALALAKQQADEEAAKKKAEEELAAAAAAKRAAEEAAVIQKKHDEDLAAELKKKQDADAAAAAAAAALATAKLKEAETKAAESPANTDSSVTPVGQAPSKIIFKQAPQTTPTTPSTTLPVINEGPEVIIQSTTTTSSTDVKTVEPNKVESIPVVTPTVKVEPIAEVKKEIPIASNNINPVPSTPTPTEAPAPIDPDLIRAPASPLCHTCRQATATVYCPDCNLDLCTIHHCDSTLHSSHALATHSRSPNNEKESAIHTWRMRGFPANLPPPPQTPLCQLCSTSTATLYCYDCSMEFCQDGHCDLTIHASSQLTAHVRVPISQKNQPKPVPRPAEVIAPAVVAPPVALSPKSLKVVAPQVVEPPKPAAPTPAEITKLKTYLATVPDIWTKPLNLTEKETHALLAASGNTADFLISQAPKLIAAARQFYVVNEFQAWVSYAYPLSQAKQPIIYHYGDSLLIQPLRSLLEKPTCLILKNPGQREILLTTPKLDEIIIAAENVEDLLHHLTTLHSLHRIFQTCDELISSIKQVVEMGFFLPRPLLQRIVDYVKKKPSGPTTQLFAGLNNEVPEMDGELLDSLVSNLGSSQDDRVRYEESLESKIDLCIGHLKAFDAQKRQFDSWESLCAAMLTEQANQFKKKNAPPTPTPAPSKPTASSTTSAKTPEPPVEVPESTISPQLHQQIAAALTADTFNVFADADEFQITQDALERLIDAAGEHGPAGLLHILDGLNGIGRRAKDFDHLITMVSEVVEDGAYSSRAARDAIIDYLCDEKQCRLFVVGAATSLSEHTIEFLGQTPPAKLDELILALGGSSSVPTILEHLESLSRVGNRFENFEEILTTLTHALDPEQGGGSFVGIKDWKEFVNFILKPKNVSHLLPKDSYGQKSMIESAIRQSCESFDNLFALASETCVLLQAANDQQLGMFSTTTRDLDDDASNDTVVPETALELILETLEQLNQTNKSPTPKFTTLDQLIQGVHAKIASVKAAKEAEETRKQEMLKRLNRKK